MKLLIFFFEIEFFFSFLVETQFRCNHRWTMEKSQILHHWTLFPHGYHLEYHSHLGHFCTPHQYWQLWKLPCKLWLQNCTSSMGLKSLGFAHSVWKSPKKSHSRLRAKRASGQKFIKNAKTVKIWSLRSNSVTRQNWWKMRHFK